MRSKYRIDSFYPNASRLSLVLVETMGVMASRLLPDAFSRKILSSSRQYRPTTGGNVESEPTTPRDIRVLLVEDHLLTRIGLKTVLARKPEIKVVGEAENGEQAVQLANQLKPDVILMDVGMPVMDGIEAAKKIRESKLDTNIVMLTSHDNDRDVFASLAAGAVGYCLKDVEPERLYAAISSVTAGDVWLDSTIAGKVLKHYGNEKSAGPGQENAGAPAPVSPAPSPPASVETARSGPSLAKYDQHLPEQLSPRELEVLNLLVEGLSNQEIADKLFISLATAKTHVRNILNKLAVDDRTQAAVSAMRRGLV